MHVSNTLKTRVQQQFVNGEVPEILALAQKEGISELAVLECMPPECITKVSASHFNEIMVMVATWGTVTIAIKTMGMELSVHGPLPIGHLNEDEEYIFSSGDMYALGGSIQTTHIESIYFLDGSQYQDPCYAILFFDYFGSCMFKILPQKDEQQKFDQEQVEYLRTMRDRITEQPGCSCCS
ncbi:MAG: hypothetical protein CSA26_00425 [Desulfobacterales bacterium]|nr:MAG: hypothetical protein CSA26_00425 [Desulfobacterales bacterium]